MEQENILLMDTVAEKNDLYRKNLLVLEKVSPDSALKLKEYNDKLSLSIGQASAGEYLMLQKQDGAWVPFCPPQGYHKEEIFPEMNKCINTIKALKNHGFIFYGLDVGLRLTYIFDNTDKYCPIFVVERHPEVLKAIISSFDIRLMLESGRVFFFFGEEAAVQAVDFINNNLNMYLPVSASMFCRDTDSDFYLNAARYVNENIKKIYGEILRRENIQKIYSHYRSLTPERLLSKFSFPQEQQLNILGELNTETRVMQYVMKDCMEAFKNLGHKTFILEFGGVKIATQSYMIKAIENFLPDLWFKINHTSKEGFFLSDNLLTVTWVQDPIPRIFNPDIKAEDKIGRYDQLLVITKEWLKELERIGFPKEKLHLFHFGANTQIYHPRQLSKHEQEQYRCDISFVCHYPAVDTSYSLLSKEFADEIISRMQEEERYSFIDLLRILKGLEKKYAKINVSQADIHAYAWSGISSAALRIPYLEAIADKDLHIWGLNWEKDDYFRAYAKGPAQQGEQCCKIYNASKININLSHTTNNHPRIFDIVASGGFLLTYLTHEDEGKGGIGELFEIGKEIEVFRNKKEFKDKVEYYLSHDKEREELARRGLKRLLREHTMKHRMQRVIEIVSGGLG